MSKFLSALLLGIAVLLLASARAPTEQAQASASASTILVLPAGTYTAIIFTATGVPEGTAAIGVLKVGTDQFPVNIGPGVTVAIPFGNGWVLERDAEVRLSKGAGTTGAVPSAWAVTPKGPVELKPQ